MLKIIVLSLLLGVVLFMLAIKALFMLIKIAQSIFMTIVRLKLINILKGKSSITENLNNVAAVNAVAAKVKRNDGKSF
jgi:hypothetical protein